MLETGKPVYAIGLADRTAGFASHCDNLTPSADQIYSFIQEKLVLISVNICIFGSSGLVGQAFHRIDERHHNLLLTPSHTELDLTEQTAVAEYFERYRPDRVIFAAARVGGIHG